MFEVVVVSILKLAEDGFQKLIEGYEIYVVLQYLNLWGGLGINAGNWVDSAQDQDYRRALVNEALNLRVP